ncbi:uncharacterized protein LOC113566892 [Drosophila persimilis]|uniref:uncharacterized protein LOC113566892 n=1 Tax=Drosophila persimilis TaxID=7234 RepID=UPI000F08B852|nr:uncharacterized protein LOC113566892 [Drosophila persimilis]
MTLVRGALLEAGCRGDAHEKGSEEQLGVSPGVASVFVHASGTTTMSTTGTLDLLRPDCDVPVSGALLHRSAESLWRCAQCAGRHHRRCCGHRHLRWIGHR